jgi:acyl-CoA thioesterase FadM
MPAGHFHHSMQVGFRDTDASGWMHFPNVFCFVEEAECAFLHHLGVLVYDRAVGGWPRVKVECQYRAPLLAWNRITVLLRLARVGNSSLHWEFDVVNDDTGNVSATGAMVTVRVDATGKTTPIPDGDRAALEAAAAKPPTPLNCDSHGN